MHLAQGLPSATLETLAEAIGKLSPHVIAAKNQSSNFIHPKEHWTGGLKMQA